MRTTVLSTEFWRPLAAVLAGVSLAGGIYAAQPEAVVKPTTTILIRSEFIDDPKVGKDPFFPVSGRRQPVKEITGTPVLGTTLKLKLGGVSGTKENRLAIINNKTYAVGEEFEAKGENRTHKVRVEEIKDRSVIINVEGLTQELTLGQPF